MTRNPVVHQAGAPDRATVPAVTPSFGRRVLHHSLCAMLALSWIATELSPAAAEEPEFRWSRSVEMPVIEENALVAIPLDSALFAATQPDLADVRLRDDRDRNVAFVIRSVPTTRRHTVRKTWTAKRRGAKPLESGGLEIFLDVDNDSPLPQGLRVISPLRNFEHQVRVDSSADGTHWEAGQPPTVIFDYSRFVDVRNVNVPIKAGEHRHFRLVIDDVTAEQASQLLELTRRLRGPDEVHRDETTTITRRPFRVDRIEFYRDVVESRTSGVETVAYKATDLQVSEDSKNKQTFVRFKTQREPLTSLTLVTDATNFSRAAHVQVPEAREKADAWRTIAAATLSRFSLNTIHQNDVSIEFPEQRQTQYRLVLENQDSPPLEIERVDLAGPAYELVFLGTPEQQLSLDYGSPEASAASYDTAAVRVSLAAGDVPKRAQLGTARENAAALEPRPWRWSNLIGYPPVAIAGIILLTAILGWGLYQASRRLDSTPPE